MQNNNNKKINKIKKQQQQKKPKTTETKHRKTDHRFMGVQVFSQVANKRQTHMISEGNAFELGLQNFECECHKQRQWVKERISM